MRDEFVSSIISIVPFKIGPEEKPGLYPGSFTIPASKNGIPEILIIGSSIHYVEVDVDKSIRVEDPSYIVAESIVYDYVSSQLGVQPETSGNRGPGIFWKSGRYDLNKVYKELTDDLNKAKERQNNWFLDMIKIADDDWEKFRQHRVITDMQRAAAKLLNLERPWSVAVTDIKSIKCPACQNVLNSDVIVCPNCRCIINLDKYKTLQFATVGK